MASPMNEIREALVDAGFPPDKSYRLAAAIADKSAPSFPAGFTALVGLTATLAGLAVGGHWQTWSRLATVQDRISDLSAQTARFQAVTEGRFAAIDAQLASIAATLAKKP